jgi:hypothetical protein
MFEFQKLEVYKKAKIFHIECREVIEKKIGKLRTRPIWHLSVIDKMLA